MVMYVLYAFLALVCIGIFWAILKYNQIVHLKGLTNEAFSGIDVQCKRRSDLIPNLVAIVKQYSIHEKDVLENITRMRSIAVSSTDLDQRSKAESGISGALKTLFAVSENYPDLKANQNFLSLQQDLTNIEHELNLARRYYNGTARNYNVQISIFPANLFAKSWGFSLATYFELSSENERNAPRINF